MAQPSARRREAPLLVPAEIRTVESRPDAPYRRWFRLTTMLSADRVELRSPLPLDRGARVRISFALPPGRQGGPAPRVELPGTTGGSSSSAGRGAEGPQKDAPGRDDERASAITFAKLDETVREGIEAYLAERLETE